MIGYVTLGTNDLKKAAAFYDKIAAEMGIGRFIESDTFIAWGSPDGGAGFGIDQAFRRQTHVGRKRRDGCVGRQGQGPGRSHLQARAVAGRHRRRPSRPAWRGRILCRLFQGPGRQQAQRLRDGLTHHDLAPQRCFQVMEVARIAFMKTTHGPTKSMASPELKNFPPHRRQGRLVAAGRFRRRRSAVCVACGAGRRPCRVARRRARPSDRPSGSIALGRSRRSCRRAATEESQAAAAVGQIELARIWSEVLSHHRIGAGEILVTLQDTEERRRYLDARSTIAKLLEWRAVPVINENDTVATNEIRYGDNDRLAARVATMASADLLILLSDIDGLYDAPPGSNPNAKLISSVEDRHIGNRGDGGRSGIRAVARRDAHQDRGGKDRNHVGYAYAHRIRQDRASAAGDIGWRALHLVSDAGQSVTARKRWIAVSLEPKGTLTIDAGAVNALRAGKSLLPAGVTRVEGQFARGDEVVVRGPDTGEIGRGLVAYDADDADKIKGRSSQDVMAILGVSGRRGK